MATETTNREFKDRLFKFIFGNEKRKEYTLALYNALNHTSYDDPDVLELTTIEDVIYLGMKNDVSFLIDGWINLYEQQSTWNPNMPVRSLMYLGKQYNKYIKANDMNIYGSRLLPLPTPRCVVFCNGDRDMPGRTMLQLTDAFRYPGQSDVNVTVTMININSDSDDEILAECKPLREYAAFVATVRELLVQGEISDRDAAVGAAVDQCVKEGILRDILVQHKSEVVDMILTEYDEEDIYRLMKRDAREEGLEEGREEGRAEGREEGRAEGREEGRAEERRRNEEENKERIRKLHENGIPVETIAECMDYEQDQVRKILEEKIPEER